MFLAIVAICLTVYISFTSKNEVENVVLAPENIDNTLLANNDETVTFATSTKWLSVEIDYPNNNIVRDAIMADYYLWASSTHILTINSEVKAKEFMISEGMQYEYIAEYEVASSSDSVSYVYDIYNFTGGAHGGVYKRVYTFDKSGKEKTISISNASIQKVLPQIRTDLKKQMIQRAEIKESEIDTKWLSDGTAVSKENYSTYWYDGYDVVFYFGQYQVGPYVYGEFEVRIPISSL